MIAKKAGQAIHVLDGFHVMQKMNKAVDVRRISFIDAWRWLQSAKPGDPLPKLVVNRTVQIGSNHASENDGPNSVKLKWSERDSNPRPLHCERSALPTELPPLSEH